jgi:archaellum component FlaC
MGMSWEKLFKNNPTPAKDSRALAIRYEPVEEAPSANSGAVITSLGALASGDQGRNGEAKSLKVARTFDSIGRRSEGLRTHLDGIELSFRNIEAIRSQFYEALGPIDQTLIEIERTKVAHLETERKFEGLSEAHERLRADHAVLTLDRNALDLRHQEASERLKDVEKALAAAETSASEARAELTERKAKLERTERELEDDKRRLHTVSEQLPAIRAEFGAKEKRLQEVEQQRAALQDQNALMAQENKTLRARIEEFVANSSKLNRQVSDLEGRRDDLTKRVEELESTLAQERAAHVKLKAAHLDAAESHRLTASNLREELGAMASRSEAAEKLLAEARGSLREREADIRGFEQRAVESASRRKPKMRRSPMSRRTSPRRALRMRKSTWFARPSISARPSWPKRWRRRARRCSGPSRRSLRLRAEWPSSPGRWRQSARSSRRGWPSSRNSLTPNKPHAPSLKEPYRPHDRNAALGATTRKAPSPERTADPSQREPARQDHPPARVSRRRYVEGVRRSARIEKSAISCQLRSCVILFFRNQINPAASRGRYETTAQRGKKRLANRAANH